MKSITNLPIKSILTREVHALSKRLRPLISRSALIIHIALISGLSVFVYQSSHHRRLSSAPIVPRTVESEAPAVIDEVASAGIAAVVAKTGGLTEKENVANQADSLTAQVNFATVDENYLARPQIVVTDTKTRKDIITYKTVGGDTVGSLAAKFNVTSDTIRWANGLTGDALAPDKELQIPPINGVLYTVKAGDTPESLASKYKASKEQIIFFNDIELTGLKVGEKIMIPGGSIEAVVVRTTRTSTSTSSSSGSYGFAFGTEPLYGGNGYSLGYCTWHAANRRIQIGRPLPRNLGNAVTWYALAQQAGIAVGSQPQAGAVLWHRDRSAGGGLGHVAFVEKVNEDGSILVSDMNYPIWNRITTRTIQPSEFGRYGFIY